MATYEPKGFKPFAGYQFTGSAFVFKSRVVTDIDESMAMITRSSSRAVGAEPRTGGAIAATRNLAEQDGFGVADHGGQFDRNIQRVPKFYRAFLDACSITGGPSIAPGPRSDSPPSQFLDDSWTVTVAGSGESAPVDASGSFKISGVPADNRFVRILGSGVQNGKRVYLNSDYLDVPPPAGELYLPGTAVRVTASPALSPVSLSVANSAGVISPWAKVQLAVTAVYSDGTSADATSRAKGTRYSTTSPGVATVNDNGLVTAIADGTAFIIMTNEGVTTVRRIDVASSTFTTTITGVAMLPGGTPAAGASITTLPFGGSATAGTSGGFSISPVVPSGTTNIKASGSLLWNSKTYTGTSALLAISPGGITDAGLLQLNAPYDGPLFPGPHYSTSASPYSVAIGDLDGDGRPDLAVANGSSVSVLRNQGNGTFATKVDYATGSVPRSVAIGDVDGDGRPDLVVANSGSNTVSVLRNLANGTFAAKVDYVTGSGPYSVAIGDLDGDGRPDLAVANSGSNSVSVRRNVGNGTFANNVEYSTGSGPFSVAIGDIDGDGRPDLAVANNGSNTVSVLRNLSSAGGGVTFATKVDYATGLVPFSVAIGDVDGDGRPDLAVAANSGRWPDYVGSVSVFRNLGNGTFATKADYATGSRSYSVAIGDLDGDGLPDLAVANGNSRTVSVLRNLSSGGGTSRSRPRWITPRARPRNPSPSGTWTATAAPTSPWRTSPAAPSASCAIRGMAHLFPM